MILQKSDSSPRWSHQKSKNKAVYVCLTVGSKLCCRNKSDRRSARANATKPSHSSTGPGQRASNHSRAGIVTPSFSVSGATRVGGGEGGTTNLSKYYKCQTSWRCAAALKVCWWNSVFKEIKDGIVGTPTEATQPRWSSPAGKRPLTHLWDRIKSHKPAKL